ncbi:uncharacterized protein LOC110049226 [Orbicella faveolata]|uniref:uncharacterized protein LOC110049226 n=1 Tax=Orbicella faveolata TaxID=48498 RepID=UPI0009E631CA|nr:uncharacterized protein LOC110049226 [Orbicella faveolata]
MSAILRLLGFNNPAPIFHSANPLISIQSSADDVRENVRNTWGHFDVTDWTKVFFTDCFSKLNTLVRSVGLTGGMEKTTLDHLSDWETKGCQLCMGHAVDQNLLSLVQQDVKNLVKDYKTTEESLAQQRVDLTAMQNTVISIQDQQSATRAQLEEHDQQLAAVLEWKEQQMKENEDILQKLVSVEKMLSEELLIRVEGVEKGLAETDNKLEQLEQGFAKRDGKVEQLEQAFAKTDDKVKQLEQGFSKTDNKVEQLEQGFAKTDDKVEQLEQGFAKVEKDVSETGNKVKQLEEVVRSHRMKENKPASSVETFDVKSCQSKLAEHYKRTATVPTSVWTKKSPVDIHQIYTRLSWVKEEQNPSGSSQSKLAHYTDVFTANKNGVLPKRILVQGQTGIGKSTFVKKLAVDWAELDDKITGDTKNDALTRFEDGRDEHVSEDKEATFQDNKDPSRSRGKHEDMSETQRESLKKFELVLVINLKEVSKCSSLREIVRSCSIFPEEETALVDDLLSYITKNQEKVLLVFDGYDEYRCGSNSEIYEIFRGKKLRNCCVLITTRISKADDLREFKDVHAEITGFSKEDRVDFMIKVLGGKAEAEELRLHLSRKKLTDLTSVPLLLLFFCTLWKKGKLKSFPENKTKLYLGIVQYVLDYNQGKDSPARFGKVHDFKEVLAEIGKVALECLLKDDHVFEYDQLSDAIRCDESLIIGLLQVTEHAENLRPAGMVSFIHKSIQEFLAALFIAYKCVSEGNLGGIEQHARTLEDCKAFENVFQFVCGLSDEGAVKILEHLKSVRISDPTLDLSKTIPDVETETGVPLFDVTGRPERFNNLVYDSFREVKSNAELLSHFLDCIGGVIPVTRNRPLSELMESVNVLTKLARDCVFYLPFISLDEDGEYTALYKSLEFLNCLQLPLRITEGSEVLTFEDFIRKFRLNRLGRLRCFFSFILCFRNGQFQCYITELYLQCDDHARLFTESNAIAVSSATSSLCSEQSCLKFLSSLRWYKLSAQTVKALGAVIRNCKHLSRIEVMEVDDSICYLFEQVRNPSKCSLTIDASNRSPDVSIDLTSTVAVQLASLLPRFNNVIALNLDLSHCDAAALNTLVTSITHKTLEKLIRSGTSLTPAEAAALGRSLPEMSSLQVLELTGVDGSILQAEEMEALFGGFNKMLPLVRLAFRNFSSRGCLAALCKSFRFFSNLKELNLEKLDMNEHDQCSLVESLRFLCGLTALNIQETDQQGYAHCYTTKSNTRGIQATLNLEGVKLTPAVAMALGRSLPEMSSLLELRLTGVDGSILQAEEMVALFGRLYKLLPLREFVFKGYCLRSCISPLNNIFHFFPNVRRLELEKLNMDEDEQCSLLESLRLIPDVTSLSVQSKPLVHGSCCAAKLTLTSDFFPLGVTSKSLDLNGISLTSKTSQSLGRLLPQMLSLTTLEFTGEGAKSILHAKEIKALFGGFSRILPLRRLVFGRFDLRGSVAPITNSFCFFPSLVWLDLLDYNMDEHDLCGLLESLRFLPNLMELTILGRESGQASCCKVEANNVCGFTHEALRELLLIGINLTPRVAAVLGRILPEMSSLQDLRLRGTRGNILQAEEMTALFGKFNKTLPLKFLTFSDFSVRGCLAPLTESFRFFPNLEELSLGGYTGELNLDEYNLCALLQNLSFIPNLKTLSVKGQTVGDAHCCTAEVNTMASFIHKTLEQLQLDKISLTSVSAALLGRLLPGMSSLQVLELSGVEGSILQAEKMEALFGGFNKTLPLHRLTFRNFSSRGSLAILCKNFHFFPNLKELELDGLNMNEHDQCSLLESLRFMLSLRALSIQSTRQEQEHVHCHPKEFNTFRSFASEAHKGLHVNGISLTPAVAAALGRSLPEMPSLHVLQLMGVKGSILQAEQMESLFGRFNNTMHLCELTFSGFSVRGCLSPLIKSLHFFPSLRELKLERLDMDEHDQCGLLTSFGFIRNLTELSVRESGEECLSLFYRNTTEEPKRRILGLDGISLTPPVTTLLGRLLPEMSSLQILGVTGVHRRIFKTEEMEALFGGFYQTLPLHELTLRSLSVRGCLAPLFRNLHFFPNLIDLRLAMLNMDEHDLNGLLDSFQFIPNLGELNLSGNPLGHAVTSIVPHVINLKRLQYLWILNTGHSEEDLIYVRETVQQALPELKINRD